MNRKDDTGGTTSPEKHEAAPPSSARRSGFSLGGLLKGGLAFVVTGGFVYWILAYQVKDPARIAGFIRNAAVLPLLVILPLSFVSHLLRAWRWRRFIGRPVPLFYAFTSVMIGYAVNDVLPRVGEVVRVVNMNRITRVPLAHLVTTLVAERVLDVLALVVLLGLSLLLEGGRIAAQFPELARAGPVALAGALGGLVLLFAVAFASEPLCRASGALARRLHPRLGDRVEGVIRQGAEGLAFLRKPSQALPVLIETTGIWALYLLAFLLGLSSFGLLEEIGLRGGTVAFSVSTAGVLVPAVGAIGPYHEFGKTALTQLYHVDSDRALAFVTVIHAVLFYVVGGLGGVAAWGAQVWKRRREEVER